MTEEQRNTLRDAIIDRQIDVEVRIAELEESTKPISPDKGLGRLTRLEAMQDKSINENALERLRQEEIQLHNAMANIAMPDFGHCQSCGGGIAFERMEALPASTLCAQCAG